MSIDIESLGFTEEELQERIVNQVCEDIMVSAYPDEDGEVTFSESRFGKAIEEKVRAQIDAKISAIADEKILPNVYSMIEDITIQKTNEYGEKKSEPLTFIEYMTQRAENYLTEKVDAYGKSMIEDGGGYNWHGKQARIAYMVHRHLHNSIETAMKEAMKNANSLIAEGIHETVKIKLDEIAKKISLKVVTGK